MKKIILMLVAFSLLVLSGCDGGETTTSGYSPFIGGSEGLDMEFVTGAPPDEIFDNGKSSLPISVNLENVGEFDIEKGSGFVEVRGISADEFGVSGSELKKSIPAIQGARKSADGSAQNGLAEVVTFSGLSYQQDLAGDLPINNLRVRACYDYETKASAQLCLKPGGVDGLKDDEICMISETKTVANSASPIHVENLKEFPRGKEGIMISFDIVHQGPANYKWFSTGDDVCDDSLNNEDLYALEVEVDPIVNNRYRADCARLDNSDRGEIILTRGAPQTVVCTFDIGEQDVEFETPVSVKLKYRYSQYIEKQILVKDLGVSN